jgi:hypothetical protein
MADKDRPTITIPVAEYEVLTNRILPLYHTERKPSGDWAHLITITKAEYEKLLYSPNVNQKIIVDMAADLIKRLDKLINGK